MGNRQPLARTPENVDNGTSFQYDDIELTKGSLGANQTAGHIVAGAGNNNAGGTVITALKAKRVTTKGCHKPGA